MPRERDVRAAVKDALMLTDAFDEVHLSEPEVFGFGTSEGKAAIVEPVSWTDRDLFDGGAATGGYRNVTLRLTFIARNPDPESCDADVEDLLQFARNALNGRKLVPGFTIPDWTKVGNGTWLPRVHPERRIQADLLFAYEYDGWADNETGE